MTRLFMYSFARWRFYRNFVTKGCLFVVTFTKHSFKRQDVQRSREHRRQTWTWETATKKKQNIIILTNQLVNKLVTASFLLLREFHAADGWSQKTAQQNEKHWATFIGQLR